MNSNALLRAKSLTHVVNSNTTNLSNTQIINFYQALIHSSAKYNLNLNYNSKSINDNIYYIKQLYEGHYIQKNVLNFNYTLISEIKQNHYSNFETNLQNSLKKHLNIYLNGNVNTKLKSLLNFKLPQLLSNNFKRIYGDDIIKKSLKKSGWCKNIFNHRKTNNVILYFKIPLKSFFATVQLNGVVMYKGSYKKQTKNPILDIKLIGDISIIISQKPHKIIKDLKLEFRNWRLQKGLSFEYYDPIECELDKLISDFYKKKLVL